MIHHYYAGESALEASRRLFRLIHEGAVTLGGNLPGKIYGRLDCRAGRRMKRENRVFFADEGAAIAAGFRPCARCMPEAYRIWKTGGIAIGEPAVGTAARGYDLRGAGNGHVRSDLGGGAGMGLVRSDLVADLGERLGGLNWEGVASSLHDRGFAWVPGVLSASACETLIAGYGNEVLYRKTVDMQRYRFGAGEYKYYRYPLPGIVQMLREGIYPHIVPVADEWMRRLGMEMRFPAELSGMRALCHAEGQLLPTPLILTYDAGGFNTMHQDLYGRVYFPMQVLFVLSQEGVDFTGGEFVLTEQVPRAQSKAQVLRPGRGDMLIFTTNFRPVAGSRGYYRAAMRHGVSPVLTGRRYAMGVIFHDAVQ